MRGQAELVRESGEAQVLVPVDFFRAEQVFNFFDERLAIGIF